MSVFPPNNILEEEIFSPRNLNADCDTIGDLLYDYAAKFIFPALEDEVFSFAVENYLQVLDSLTAHFIADEHWCWFDDLYSPDYTLSTIWDRFAPYVRSGALKGEDLAELEAGLLKIEASEAYTEYGYPSMIPFRDLVEYKSLRERILSQDSEI